MNSFICKISVSIVLIFLLMVSCSKEQSGASYFNETYAGTYRLVSATYAPDPDYLTDPILMEAERRRKTLSKVWG